MTLFPPRRQGPKPTSPFKQVLRIHIHTHTRSHGMSLLQRVTSIDGNDLDTSSVHNYNNNNKDQRYGTVRSLRTVISYDILPQPEEDSFATHPTGGVTAYKVSEAQRLGMLCAFLFISFRILSFSGFFFVILSFDVNFGVAPSFADDFFSNVLKRRSSSPSYRVGWRRESYLDSQH